jgi:hypothetical protein
MANVLGALFQNIADAIRDKNGSTNTMKPADFPSAIAAIGTGGGSSEDVKYVTFMSEDGTTELYRKAVLAGDDCADVVARGLLEAPTKESTNTEVFVFVGWSTEPNGALNADALKDVTADRTVYANFASVTRYYTVRFYDGETLLNTLQVQYGATADYVTTKDGFSFIGWQPSNTNITQNTDCYAQWIDQITFANASWAQIAEISEAGNAASMFNIGDTKPITLNNGFTCTVQIVGFNHDTLTSDSTKTAGISLLCVGVPNILINHTPSYSGSQSNEFYYGWNMFNERTDLENQMYGSLLPTEVTDVIKQVKKKYRRYAYYGSTVSPSWYVSNTDDNCWLPSAEEVGMTHLLSDLNDGLTTNAGNCYALFADSANYTTVADYLTQYPVVVDGTTDAPESLYLRDGYGGTSTKGSKGACKRCKVTPSAILMDTINYSNVLTNYNSTNSWFGFCV